VAGRRETRDGDELVRGGSVRGEARERARDGRVATTRAERVGRGDPKGERARGIERDREQRVVETRLFDGGGARAQHGNERERRRAGCVHRFRAVRHATRVVRGLHRHLGRAHVTPKLLHRVHRRRRLSSRGAELGTRAALLLDSHRSEWFSFGFDPA
jgi:hypothetical protein